MTNLGRPNRMSVAGSLIQTVRRLKIKDALRCTLLHQGGAMLNTVNHQKRPAGLILSLRVQMRVLLEFGLFAYCFSSLLQVLLEFGSYSRAGLSRGFTVYGFKCIQQGTCFGNQGFVLSSLSYSSF